ncbi:GDP-fucose protein O-fucosyltransferase [Tanacetum coccineum]|uniref:O-fucosyltransferase family protein n=1 Tax=Tanacetum coccineum TaxID=301880 RepID=A0ABQ5EJM7_9ASTR
MKKGGLRSRPKYVSVGSHIVSSSVGPRSYDAQTLVKIDVLRVNQYKSTEPKDLWMETYHAVAATWQPCADQRVWKPSGIAVYKETMVTANGGINQQRVAVCNIVAVARLLNATLVLPSFMFSSVWRDTSQFADIYQDDYFIDYLKPDIRIVKELPKELQSLVVTDVDIAKEAKPSSYLKFILPLLMKNCGVRGNFIQRLRCRCNFHALQFTPKIQATAALLIQRMRQNATHSGLLDENLVGPFAKPKGKIKKDFRFLALHLRFEIDMVAHSLCAARKKRKRHHFIRDSYEKRLIEMVKIHTDKNVVDLLTKAFDVSRFNFAVASIGQTTTGKEFSNPLMAGSLPKTISAKVSAASTNLIVDFLSSSSINYALTVSPTIYASYIEQFWNTATSKTINFVKQIRAIVDGRAVAISESSVRSDLLLNDEDGITCLTNAETFENLSLMGYEQPLIKLTFQKGSFSPQWKFLIHTILYCISSKSTAWNEFSTNLASTVICLTKGQKFIFDGILRNLDSKKFLMYPRFLQLFLNNQLKDLPETFNDTYETPCHTKKVFSNMARPGKKISGHITPLFDSMLVQNQTPGGEGSSNPPKPQPTPSTSQPHVSEPQVESHPIETPPTTAPQTETHQTAVSHNIVFHEAHVPTTYQRQRRTHKHRRTKKDIELPQTSVPLNLGVDKAVHKEGDDNVERAITTDASLDAEQDNDNIIRTQTTAIPNVDIPQGIDTGGSPRRQDTIGEGHTSGSGEGRMKHTFELTENVPPTPHDSPLIGGYTLGSNEGRMKLDELLLDLEKEKDAQAMEMLNLKKIVKRLERKRKSSILHSRRRSYRQISSDADLDEEDASK